VVIDDDDVAVVVMIWLIHHCVEKNEVNQDSQDI
jgi:hypothetical protein